MITSGRQTTSGTMTGTGPGRRKKTIIGSGDLLAAVQTEAGVAHYMSELENKMDVAESQIALKSSVTGDDAARIRWQLQQLEEEAGRVFRAPGVPVREEVLDEQPITRTMRARRALHAPAAVVAPPWRVDGSNRRQIQKDEAERQQLAAQSACSSLQSACRPRSHVGAPQPTTAVASEPRAVETLMEQGRRYLKMHEKGETERAELPSVVHGNPHLRLSKMTTGTLTEMNIDSEDKGALKTYVTRFEDADYVPARAFVYRLVEAHDAGKSKLVLSCCNELRQVLGALIRALQTLGTEWELGKAPRSPAERAVGQLPSRFGA